VPRILAPLSIPFQTAGPQLRPHDRPWRVVARPRAGLVVARPIRVISDTPDLTPWLAVYGLRLVAPVVRAPVSHITRLEWQATYRAAGSAEDATRTRERVAAILRGIIGRG